MTQTMERLVDYPQVERSKEQLELITGSMAYLAILSLDIEREDPMYDDKDGTIRLSIN